MAGRNSAWALIKDGIVMNTIDCVEGYYMANILATSSFGDGAYAIDINQYMCGMNDLYKNGNFYYINEETSEEVAYPRLPTDQEEIMMLNYEVESANEYNVDNDFRLSLLELQSK